VQASRGRDDIHSGAQAKISFSKQSRLLYCRAMRASQTLEDEYRYLAHQAEEQPGLPEPGLILIFSAGQPTFAVIPLDRGSVVVGRGEVGGVMIRDRWMSHPHARISFDSHSWTVEDLDSRNGSAVDGVEIPSGKKQVATGIVRMGHSIFLLAEDVHPFRTGITRSGDTIMGPRLQRTFAAIARAANPGRVLLINGETGAGKEFAARAFHDASSVASGPFVAVNAATLKSEFAEVHLFGAVKGAFPNATGGPGYIQKAHGGTFFLDEIAELELAVQAKLLRVLQEREVIMFGAVKPEPVNFRFCSATHADLQSMVAKDRMRADLYHRIATPSIMVPPLRERLEEIPSLIQRAVEDPEASKENQKLVVHASFVEACLLRTWPGNVRELLTEVKNAARWAADDGGVLLARHLSERAGQPGILPLPTKETPAGTSARPAVVKKRPSDDEILQALQETGFKVATAARRLNMHRTQLYRWLEAHPGVCEDGGKDD
jgi:transcriptional regulator of acetoin/glycerol metabolism